MDMEVTISEQRLKRKKCVFCRNNFKKTRYVFCDNKVGKWCYRIKVKEVK
jgi:hypothetical protein